MIAGYSFRPRAWAALAAAAACAAGIALGNWQAGRAHEKQAMAAQRERAMEAPPVELEAQAATPGLAGRRVAAGGHFLPQYTVFLDNRLREAGPGYEVLTPLRLVDGTHVLVNRGWVAAGRTRDQLPRVTTPPGPVRIEGLALARLPRALSAGEGRGPVRQNVTLDALEKETGLRLLPVVIEQHSALADGLLREWPRADAGAEKHAAYAFQWYALAALAVVLFVTLSFHRVRAS